MSYKTVITANSSAPAVTSPITHRSSPRLLILSSSSFSFLENNQQPQIIANLQGTSTHKTDPEQVMICQDTGDEGSQTLRTRLDDIDQPHYCGPLRGQENGDQEGGAGSHVHGLRARAEGQQCEGEGDV